MHSYQSNMIMLCMALIHTCILLYVSACVTLIGRIGGSDPFSKQIRASRTGHAPCGCQTAAVQEVSEVREHFLNFNDGS
jgi:starvation-inducible outer membrane lipoprotein